MPTDYAVIGEHREDDQHLLLLGEDGEHYDYHLGRDHVAPIEELDEQWVIDGRPGNEVPPEEASVLP